MRGLQGKAAIVTGAAQGIGKAIAERLTEEGVQVLWADINEQKVHQAQGNTGKGIAMKVRSSAHDSMKLQKVVSGTSNCSWSTHFITRSVMVAVLCRWISPMRLKYNRWC